MTQSVSVRNGVAHRAVIEIGGSSERILCGCQPAVATVGEPHAKPQWVSRECRGNS